MTSSIIRSATSCITAFSLAAALVVGVFSQSHAAIDEAAQAAIAEPCPGHMTAPIETASEAGCLTLCDAADMDHLIGVLSDRNNDVSFTEAVLVYDTPVTVGATKLRVAAHTFVRGPPGTALYLTTQRIRL